MAVTIEQIVNMANALLPKHCSKAALQKARKNCPINTGELYDSLYVDITKKGFILGASADHADEVENGRDEIIVPGTYVAKIKRHKRKTKNGKIIVRAHVKKYTGMKPVLINAADQEGEDTEGTATSTRSAQVWRTLRSQPAREGIYFMRDAADEAVVEGLKALFKSLGAKVS